MPWKILKKADSEIWNERLKQSDACYLQYPYYVSSAYSSLFTNISFIKYVSGNKDVAFAAILEIGFYPFKVGIIDGGPVILEHDTDISLLINDLKKLAVQRRYLHLQIRPNDFSVEEHLKNDASLSTEIFFPFHIKEEYDLNIYNLPEDKLLASFKLQCRRKIVLAGRVPFKFVKIEDDSELVKLRQLFQEVTKTKGYKYSSFNIFENIFKKGKKHDLCDIYAAYLDNSLVNAVIVVKDAQSFYHLSSALSVKGYKYNESPSTKLHYFIMQHCFYTEHKKYYNISYGGSDNLIRFKELFNPVEVPKPPYYTYVINKKLLSILKMISPEHAASIRAALKRIGSAGSILFFI